MFDSLIAAYRTSPGLAQEGHIPWMYLDTVGLVTVGEGCMLPDANAAADLPFKRVDGGAASPADIVAAYYRVKSMAKGHAASFYKLPLILADAVIADLTARKCAGFLGDLQRAFPGFGQFPQPAQLALLDMTFNLGIAKLLREYPHFCEAIRSRTWSLCAKRCDRDSAMSAFKARNDWTRAQFTAASEVR